MTGHVVLVTDATTSLGRALIRRLDSDPRVDAVLCVRTPEHPQPDSRSAKAHDAIADLAHPRSVRDLLCGPARELRVNGLIHLAAHADVHAARTLLDVAQAQPNIESFVLRSTADIYRTRSDAALLLDEDHALNFGADAPPSVRARLEIDQMACERAARARMRIAVLRLAPMPGDEHGGSLSDYLSSRVCLRPLGYDPMLNVLSAPDAADALALAVLSGARSVFNIPGADTQPLSELVHAWGRLGIPVPGPFLGPLYALRRAVAHKRFRYGPMREPLHYGGVLDGRRAQELLGYEPRHRLTQ